MLSNQEKERNQAEAEVARGHLFKEPARSYVYARERTPGTPFAPLLSARESRSAARLACHRYYTHEAGEALNLKKPKEPLPRPPPARARAETPRRPLGLRVDSARTARAPRPARGGLQYPSIPYTQRAAEFARGHALPLRFSPLHREPARSCASARVSPGGTFLRFVALRSVRIRPSPRFAIHRCYRTMKGDASMTVEYCRAPQPGRGVPPDPPRAPPSSLGSRSLQDYDSYE